MTKKLGVLVCGEVQGNHAKKHGHYHQMIGALLGKHRKTFTFDTFMVIHGELPNNIDKCDAYIISGSPVSVYDSHSWINQLSEFIRTLDSAKKKLLGICFGHQIIAQALGGTVKKSSHGWGIGIYISKITSQHWMSKKRDTIQLLASHQDQVIKPPLGMLTIGHSPFCPHYMLQVDHHILTVQGHPEFTKDYVKDLIESRAHILTPEEYQNGQTSLSLNEDSDLFAQWMIDFIQQ